MIVSVGAAGKPSTTPMVCVGSQSVTVVAPPLLPTVNQTLSYSAPVTVTLLEPVESTVVPSSVHS